MLHLKDEIIRLGAISSQLEIPESVWREYLNKVLDYLNNFITSLEDIKAFQNNKPNRRSLSIENEKKSLDQIISLYQKEVVENGIVAASGGHLGYIPGGGIVASSMADLIAAVTNPFAGIYYASPGAVIIENEVLSWLKKIFSFPETAIGNLASGGSVSTLIALTAARDKYQIKNEIVSRSVVYLSEHVHHSIQKALRIIGLEDVIIRYVTLDNEHRIKADILHEMIISDKSRGLNPFLVIATAGTTDTGVIDPLEKIADISSQFKLWFHVDAAYGGFFILTSKKILFNGIEKADSLVVDPHKGMFLPYGLGAVLIKDRGAVFKSNQYQANYMQDALEDELIFSPANLSPELTKHFRGLRLWLPLQLHGLEPFIACLEEKLLLITYFREKLKEMGFMVGPEPDLSVSYFGTRLKKTAMKRINDLWMQFTMMGRCF